MTVSTAVYRKPTDIVFATRLQFTSSWLESNFVVWKKMESFWQLRLTESFTSVIYGCVTAAEAT
jgi:hypothetical protein